MNLQRKRRARRVALMTVTIVVATGIVIFGTLELREWQARKAFDPTDPSTILGPDNLPRPEIFAPEEAARRMAPITDFRILRASEVSAEVHGEEMVIGVVLEGQARAYSINMMTGPQREIFNDELAGHSIAATW